MQINPKLLITKKIWDHRWTQLGEFLPADTRKYDKYQIYKKINFPPFYELKTFPNYYQYYNTCNFGTTRWRKVVKSGGFKFIPSQEPYKAMVPWHEKSVIEGVVGVQNETRD